MSTSALTGQSVSTQPIDISPWYKKYIGLPYLHLGTSTKTGIDCFNLCRLIYKEQLGIDIPYTTSDFCNIVDEDWYSKTTEQWMHKAATTEFGWKAVTSPQKYDIVLMSIGSTNVTNHCALYVGDNKILQIMIDHTSWIAPYGRWYKQYTTGIVRWINMPN